MPTNEVEYWLDLASYDLRAAKAMFKSRQRLYVGFLCHLVVEKTLKAHWVHAKKSTPPFTHHLLVLASKIGIIDEMDERSKAILDYLEPLHIEGRYPTDKARLLRMLTEQKCRWLLAETRRLHLWLKSKLSEK